VVNRRKIAISLACLLALAPIAALAEALQKFYVPPPSKQQNLQQHRVDPYAKFKSYIQRQPRDKQKELLKRYESNYEDAKRRNDEERKIYYSNLIAILNRSLWR